MTPAEAIFLLIFRTVFFPKRAHRQRTRLFYTTDPNHNRARNWKWRWWCSGSCCASSVSWFRRPASGSYCRVVLGSPFYQNDVPKKTKIYVRREFSLYDLEEPPNPAKKSNVNYLFRLNSSKKGSKRSPAVTNPDLHSDPSLGLGNQISGNGFCRREFIMHFTFLLSIQRFFGLQYASANEGGEENGNEDSGMKVSNEAIDSGNSISIRENESNTTKPLQPQEIDEQLEDVLQSSQSQISGDEGQHLDAKTEKAGVQSDETSSRGDVEPAMNEQQELVQPSETKASDNEIELPDAETMTPEVEKDEASSATDGEPADSSSTFPENSSPQDSGSEFGKSFEDNGATNYDDDDGRAIGDDGSDSADEGNLPDVSTSEVENAEIGFDGLGGTSEQYARAQVLSLAQAGEGAIIYLSVDGYDLPLRMLVGAAEAMALLTAVQDRQSKRPVTHMAWNLTLAAVGWKISRLAITSLENDIYQSRVVLKSKSQSSDATSVAVRPSDGIALALRGKAPLFVAKQVADSILMARKSMPGEIDAKEKVGPPSPALQDLKVFVSRREVFSNPFQHAGMKHALFRVWDAGFRN